MSHAFCFEFLGANLDDILNKVKQRLSEGAYPNEASVSIGIVAPVLRALGWDDSDPGQVIPEFSSGGRRVDFALCATGSRPSIFIEVKGVGKAIEGERQLFEYAFHEGIPLCILTDGRDWSFFLPGAQGSYDDRRVYRLQIDQRPTSECVMVFSRYLSKLRVKSGEAVEDAMRDYRDKASRRDAARSLPDAWQRLVEQPDDLLIELISEQTERLSGFRPATEEVLFFLKGLQQKDFPQTLKAPKTTDRSTSTAPAVSQTSFATGTKAISFHMFGAIRSAPNASMALIDILIEIGNRYPEKLPEIAKAVKTRTRNHIAQTAEQIYPARPDLARAANIGHGWLIGLNISNRDKMRIVLAACETTGLVFGKEIIITMPNSEA